MKNLVLTFILILKISFGFSQAAKNDTIQLVYSYSEKQGMRLKWLPTSYPVFYEGFKNGYNIYRAEITKTSAGESRGNYIKLNDQVIKYWPESRFKTELAKDSSLAIASLFISGADQIINQKGGATQREAVETAKGNELLHFLGSFAAITNNKVADALGMLFSDITFQPGKKYLYKIEIPGKDIFTSYLLITASVKQPKEKVMGFTARLTPGVVYLSWFNNGNKNYPYFNIYRSEKKSGGFVKLNKIPYLGDIGKAKTDKNFTDYSDSIPAYNKTYFYKVVGVNAFEEEGTPSDVAEVKTLYMIRTAPVISKTESPDNNIINLQWAIDAVEKKYIKGYTVKRAKRGEGPYKQLHKGMLPAETQTFSDKSKKGSSNYYVVTAYGQSGDSISSLLKSHLLVDSVPPVMPVMLSGVCDTNGIVTLKWKNNKDEDLEGYRIFKVSDLRHEPERVISGHTADTVITDTVNLKRPYNKIYYRIVALDNVFNASVPSKFLEVKLPDKNPPTNGYLKDYTAGPNGIELEWEPSSAYDLHKMYLLRKGELDAQFEPLLVLKGDSLQLKKYTDTTCIAGIKYQYTVQAQDESGLKSGYSNIFIIDKPDKLKIKSVTNLAAIANRDNKMVKLTWDFPANATGFRIYRGRDKEKMTTYEYIDGDLREFYDKRLKPNSKYKYQIQAELKNGYTSGYSNIIEVKY